MNTLKSRTLKEKIADRLTGRIPLCNGICHRSPKIPFTNRYFLCWRCLAILGTFFPAFFIVLKVGIIAPEIFYVVGAALIFPCAIDGIRQTLTPYESTNPTRVKVGLPAGVGLALLAVVIEIPM